MPIYRITLIDVHLTDDATAKSAALGAAGRILGCGGEIQSIQVEGEDGYIFSIGPEEILTRQDILREAALAPSR